MAVRAGLRWCGELALLALAYIVDFLGVDTGLLRTGGSVPVQVLRVLGIPIFVLLALLRRRSPRLMLVVALVYSVMAAALVPAYEPFTAALIMLYTVASRARTAEAVGWLVATVPLIAVNTVNAGWAGNHNMHEYAVAALLWAIVFGIAWTSARFTYRFSRMAELREAAQAAEAALAVQQERLRLARELHDIVAHGVTAMVLQAAGARALSDNRQCVENALEAIERSGAQTMRELRRLLGLLRSGPADEPQSEDGASLAEIGKLIETTRACGVLINMSTDGQPVELDESVDHAAYRIVGEALTNAIKHDGPGASVHLHFHWSALTLRITTRSRRGVGHRQVDTLNSGYGLTGVAERVHALGGSVHYGELSATEYILDAELPLSPVAPSPTPRGSQPARTAVRPW